MHGRLFLLAAALLLGCSCIPHTARARHLDEHPKYSWRLLEAVDLASGVQLTVNASTFTEQRQPVTVAWSGVTSPSPDDMIALYVPADADPASSVPVEFLSCQLVAPGYSKTGNGSTVFRLLNMRQSFRFALVKGALSKPTLIAQSFRIDNLIPHRPTGLHLALHEDQMSVVVQWVAGTSQFQQVRLRRQGEPASASRTLSATSAFTYAARQMCGFPANSSGFLDPGFTQSAVLRGGSGVNGSKDLQPGQRYLYSVGSDQAGWSKEYSFLAPVGPGWNASSSEPEFVFLNFNDIAMQNAVMKASAAGGLTFLDTYGVNSTFLSQRLATGVEAGAHLALALGDLSYAQGYSADWDYFGDQFVDVLTQWPVAVASGNHERDYPNSGDAFNNLAADSGGECNVPFVYRWYSPAHALMDPDVSYYSFAQGPVHFLIIDTEMPTEPGTPQHRFVTAALAAVDRRVTPWLVVGMHRMMAAPSTWSSPVVGDVEVMERLQDNFEDLFFKHQVDLVLQGHEHAYARTCPMYPAGNCSSPSLANANTTTDNGRAYAGPVYVLAGHAGARATNVFPHPLPGWVVAGAEATNGYLKARVTDTTLRMESIRSTDGTVMDAFELTRGAARGGDAKASRGARELEVGDGRRRQEMAKQGGRRSHRRLSADPGARRHCSS